MGLPTYPLMLMYYYVQMYAYVCMWQQQQLHVYDELPQKGHNYRKYSENMMELQEG